MGKRHHKGAYIHITPPKSKEPLPTNMKDLIDEAIQRAVLYAHEIWRKKTELRDGDVHEFKVIFRQLVERNTESTDDTDTMESQRNNNAAFHLLMACFFVKVYEEIRNRSSWTKIRTRNSFLILGMSQRELSRAFLNMTTADAEQVRENGSMNEHSQDWKSTCTGAKSVARAVQGFLDVGMDVFFPTAYYDIQGRFDLMVRTRGNTKRWCVQVKSGERTDRMTEQQIRKTAIEDPNGPEHYLIAGMREFEEAEGSTWTPVTLFIGYKDFPNEGVEETPEQLKWLFDLTSLKKERRQESKRQHAA